MLDCVTRETVVRAGLDEVWSALTDAGQVAQWFGDAAEIDLRVGGALTFSWPAGEVSKGVVTVVEPRVRFGFRWDVFGTIVDPGVFTHVEFRLRPVDSGTAVRLVETGLVALVESGVAHDLEELFEEHVDGWRNEMSDLAEFVESRRRGAPAAADLVADSSAATPD